MTAAVVTAPAVATVSAAATVSTPVTVTPVALTPPSPVEALVAAPGTLVTVAAGVLSAVLAPFFPAFFGTPSIPTTPPTLWVVLAWVRRQLFNTAPTLAPGPASTDLTTGLVTGNLGARDADGDPLTFTVRQGPTNGTLVVEADGTYVYTPHVGFTGQDTFIVAVTDSGPDGLLGFLQPERGHTSAAAIALSVSAANGATYTVDGVDQRTGAVTGRLTAADLAAGTATATLATGPARGSVVVNADGSFVYTPTPIARAVASYAEEGTVVDPFTVTLVRSGGETTAVTVTPVVSSSLNALVYQVDGQPRDQRLGAPVVDPVTGRVYQVLYEFGNANAPTYYTLVGSHPDGTIIFTDRVQGNVFADRNQAEGSTRLTVDPVTGAAYLSTPATSVDGTATTVVSVITASGSTREVSIDGTSQGGVVVNPSTGAGYQLVTSFDELVGQTVRIVRFDPGGGSESVESAVGTIVGGMVTDPVTGADFLTVQYRDSDTRSLMTRLVVFAADGTPTQLSGLAGQPVGAVTLNPVTRQAVQTSTKRIGPLSTTTVVSVDEFGTISRTEEIAGPAIGGPVVDRLSGAIYQTVATPGRTPEDPFTFIVTILRTDGTRAATEQIAGDPAATGLVVNPAAGAAYLLSTVGVAQRISVITADGTVRTSALPGTVTAPLAVNPVGGSVIVTSGNTVSIVDASGAVRQLPGTLIVAPVFDAANGRAYIATDTGVDTVLTTLDADGATLGTRTLEGGTGVAPVVNPANGTVYVITQAGPLPTLTVIDAAGEVIGVHTLPGGPGLLPPVANFGSASIAELVPNPVTGGALILNSTLFQDDDGFFRTRDFISMVSPDGTGLTTVLVRPRLGQGPAANFEINPVTGVAYLTTRLTALDGFSVVVTSVFTDGATVDSDPLPDTTRLESLVIDPKTGTVFQSTESGLWIVDVAV
jgi:VCBS repeat-containing protein